MFRFVLVIPLLFLFTNHYAQKLKDRYIELHYVKLPLTPVPLPSAFHFIATELNRTPTGTTTLTVRSKTNAYDARSSFYAGLSGLGQINGFTCEAFDSLKEQFYIEIHVGLLDDGMREIKQTSNTAGNTVYQYKIPFRLQIDLEVMSPDSVVFFSRNTNDTVFNYLFPVDYKPTSSIGAYTTSQALGAAYESHRVALFAEVRNDIVSKWLYHVKMEFSSLYGRQIAELDLELHYIKEKKGGFEDVDTLVSAMDSLFVLLNSNYKGGQNTNWHHRYYQDAFSELALKWKDLLSVDQKKTEQGLTRRFDEEMTYGLLKNELWCQFFSGQMDEVISLCEQLEAARSKESDEFKSVRFDTMLKFAKDYRSRFLANPSWFDSLSTE